MEQLPPVARAPLVWCVFVLSVNSVCVMLALTFDVCMSITRVVVSLPAECSYYEFSCTDGTTCIDDRRRCDQHYDCPDRSDELNCGNYYTRVVVAVVVVHCVPKKNAHSRFLPCLHRMCLDLYEFFTERL